MRLHRCSARSDRTDPRPGFRLKSSCELLRRLRTRESRRERIPCSVKRSTSTVGLPRESKIWRACTRVTGMLAIEPAVEGRGIESLSRLSVFAALIKRGRSSEITAFPAKRGGGKKTQESQGCGAQFDLTTGEEPIAREIASEAAGRSMPPQKQPGEKQQE